MNKNQPKLMLTDPIVDLKLLVLILCLGILFHPDLKSQQSETDAEKVIHIQRIPDKMQVNIDGHINEDFWKEIKPVDDFTMRVPVEGAQPTEKTEVRLAYDTENIYLAITLYDSEPSGIKAFQKSIDADIDLEDSFTWFFDTYYDKRNAYIFAITPLGVRADALVSTGQGSNVNRNWDGIWNLSTQIGTEGWTAEVKIPFRTLNFDPENDTWGINFRRIIRRKNEEVLWTGYRLNQDIDRPQDGGKMTGLKDISQGVGLEAIPYVNLKNSKVAGQQSENDFTTGMDVNYNITSNLKASVTINTDFAETEVDDRQINLTRFPLQFPEKRDFFLEGAGIYSYAPRSGVNPYFSRKIGLERGNPIPIQFGARVLGRIGNLDVAILNVGTKAHGSLNAENFSVARLKQNIGSESTIGFIYTRRSTDEQENIDDPLRTRHTYGADLQWNTSSFLNNKILQFQAFFTFHNPELVSDIISNVWDRSSRGLRINFPNRPWFGHCSYREFGISFDPAVGFNRRNGFRRVEPSIGYRPNFPGSPIIRDMTWRLVYENLWDLDFKLLTQNLRIQPLEVRFESGDQFEIDIIRNYERLEEDFDILRDGSIVISPDEYINWVLEIEASSAPFRKFSTEIEYRTGGFWSGKRSVLDLGGTLRLIPGLNIGISYTHTSVSLDEGNFSTNLYRFQGNYDITPNLSIASILQYDDLSKVLGMNHRLRWIVTPGSDVFLVYNHNWFRLPGEYQLIDRSNILKMNYTHRF